MDIQVSICARSCYSYFRASKSIHVTTCTCCTSTSGCFGWLVGCGLHVLAPRYPSLHSLAGEIGYVMDKAHLQGTRELLNRELHCIACCTPRSVRHSYMYGMYSAWINTPRLQPFASGRKWFLYFDSLGFQNHKFPCIDDISQA